MKRKYEGDTDSTSSEEISASRPSSKISKRNYTPASSFESDGVNATFQDGLFTPKSIDTYRFSYQSSTPYRHGIIPKLLSDSLLRDVRREVLDHVSFTAKETDIYKLEQSGDLANLSGLPGSESVRLSNLKRLRDALYSVEFRNFLQEVTGAGSLSGTKTDMAINVYRPGSYLLCHDDVIGTRRLSYILYLIDPDEPWRPEWGGGLRLYETEKRTNRQGEVTLVPQPEHIKVIPPAWGQLAFFAIEPGKSFHDVEEVYHPSPDLEPDKTGAKERVRMAISGWYHIPQLGEDGYEEGFETSLAERSSLSQLQGKQAEEFDEPQPRFGKFSQVRDPTDPAPKDGSDTSRSTLKQESREEKQEEKRAGYEDDGLLNEDDLAHLLQHISASYLTPDIIEEIRTSFEQQSCVQLDHFLRPSVVEKLRQFVLAHDMDEERQKNSTGTSWRLARPPHKHRFLFLQAPPQPGFSEDNDYHQPFSTLMTSLFSSDSFRKWLSLTTGLAIAADTSSVELLARRFRRGRDYALATGYDGSAPRLEFTLGCSAHAEMNGKWEAGEIQEEAEGATKAVGVPQGEEDGKDNEERAGGTDKDNPREVVGGDTQHEQEDRASTKNSQNALKHNEELSPPVDYGGQEVFMAADEDDAGGDYGTDKPKSDPAVYQAKSSASMSNSIRPSGAVDQTSDNQKSGRENNVENDSENESHDGSGGDGEAAKKKDAAEVEEGEEEEEDDTILFTDPPSFNRLSIVLRDGVEGGEVEGDDHTKSSTQTWRLVKYLSAAAKGDRWDIKGIVEGVEFDSEDADGDDVDENGDSVGKHTSEGDPEEEEV